MFRRWYALGIIYVNVGHSKQEKMRGLILYLIICAIAIGVAIWWLPYKYHDCLKVGHSKAYCIMQLGSK